MSTKPPASTLTGLPSFISAVAVPLTIIRYSFGVCQCHGNTHPAAILARMKEGPFPGSPLVTAPDAHVGMPGNGTNCISATFLPGTAAAGACADATATGLTLNTATAAHRSGFRLL